jgi:hypothetical protein
MNIPIEVMEHIIIANSNLDRKQANFLSNLIKNIDEDVESCQEHKEYGIVACFNYCPKGLKSCVSLMTAFK